ncbi:hypothetical protein [Caballeronia sp. KNU42]
MAKLASTANEPIYAWFRLFFEWLERAFYHFRGRISIYGNGLDKEKALTSQGFFFESLEARAGVEPA